MCWSVGLDYYNSKLQIERDGHLLLQVAWHWNCQSETWNQLWGDRRNFKREKIEINERRLIGWQTWISRKKTKKKGDFDSLSGNTLKARSSCLKLTIQNASSEHTLNPNWSSRHSNLVNGTLIEVKHANQGAANFSIVVLAGASVTATKCSQLSCQNQIGWESSRFSADLVQVSLARDLTDFYELPPFAGLDAF